MTKRDRAWRWLAAVAAVTVSLTLLGPVAERSATGAACLLALLAAADARRRAMLARAAATTLLGAVLALAVHLLLDDFAYRYAWLYSAPALPWYLKLANVWGGDEGTLLGLATLLALLSARMTRHPGWTAPGALLVTSAYAGGAFVWSPFTSTFPDELLRAESQGMNAHLLTVWMAIHPPLLFTAYALVLAPVGAAAEALARGSGAWWLIAQRHVRLAWLLLSSGLAFGMWWAYEDFTFGQFWHWDPVQTSVFVVWALLGAQVHGLRSYRAGGFLGRWLPLLGMLAAAAVPASMAVARSDTLASSHRYVGDTSLALNLALAAAVMSVAALLWVRSWRRRSNEQRSLGQTRTAVLLAIGVFVALGGVATFQLAAAYAAAWMELPRPASLRPFFETVMRWSDPGELARLREAFAQWDVNGFGLNRGLAPIGVALCLLSGHAFLRLRSPARGWLLTAAVGAIACLVALGLRPLESLYRGTGMTSSHTTEIFPWLNALLVTAVYMGTAAAAWCIRMVTRLRWRLVRGYLFPVGLVHVGVVMAVVGALTASVLDSYAQRLLSYPGDFNAPRAFPDGYSIEIDVTEDAESIDGGRRAGSGGAFRSVAHVKVKLERNGTTIELGNGNAVFRDDRAPASGERGAVRQLCEILDYRYARYASGSAHRLDPFIRRGLWRDVQVWVPALEYEDAPATPARPQARASDVVVVIKTYPLLSWLWMGLALILAGSCVVTVFAWRVAPRAGQAGN